MDKKVDDGEVGMKKLFINHYSWRVLLWSIGLMFFSGQSQATSIISTATGGTAANGYQATAPTFTAGEVTRGFVMYKAGFTLPNGTSSVFYDAEGPVFGNITFGTGTSTLQLATDLRLGTTGWFANNAGMNTLDGRPVSDGPGNSILMGGDQLLDFSIHITSSLTIDGCGHTLNLSSLGNIAAFSLDNRATLTLKNMNIIVKGFSPFRAHQDTQSYLGLENVNIFLQDDTNIFGAAGTSPYSNLMTRIQGFVGVYGPFQVLDCGQRFDNPCSNKSKLTINSGSTLYMGPGVKFDITRLSSAIPAANKIGMQDSSSVLWLDGCTLTHAGGLTLKKGTVLIGDKTKIIDLQSDGATVNTDITNGLVFGDGTAANNVDVRILGGAYTMLQGCMQYKHS
jgi:hypothetical protein